MATAVHSSCTTLSYRTIAALCLLPWGVSTAAQASPQPSVQQIDQQRRAQAELREALEASERRIAAAQAEEIRKAQEREDENIGPPVEARSTTGKFVYVRSPRTTTIGNDGSAFLAHA
jgi:hypothetical protein